MNIPDETESKLKRLEKSAEALKGVLADIEELGKTRYPDVPVKIRLADIQYTLGSLDGWFALLSTCRQRHERNPGQAKFARDLALALAQLLARPWMEGTAPETIEQLEWERGRAEEIAEIWEANETGGGHDTTKD